MVRYKRHSLSSDLSEIKHDVMPNDTAKMKLLRSVFSCLYSRVNIFVFAVNGRRHFFFVCDLFKDYNKRIKYQRWSLQFAVCRLPSVLRLHERDQTLTLTFLAGELMHYVCRQKGVLSTYVNVDDMCTMRQRVSFSYYSGYQPYGHIIITATFFILAQHSFIFFYKKSPLIRLSFYPPVNSWWIDRS